MRTFRQNAVAVRSSAKAAGGFRANLIRYAVPEQSFRKNPGLPRIASDGVLTRR